MTIETENKEIENSIRENAIKLLSEKEVDVVIGYSEGSIPLTSAPIIIRKEEDVDKLVWNNLCYINFRCGNTRFKNVYFPSLTSLRWKKISPSRYSAV